MSFNLKKELEKLSSTAPVIRDVDEAYSDDETRAKLDTVDNEFEDELNVGSLGQRRIRAPIGDLSEYGTRYKGKSVSRKDLDELEDDDDEEGEEDDDEEEEEDDEELDDDEEDDDLEEDEDEEEEEEEKTTKPKIQHQKSKSEHKVNIINLDRTAEIEKGKAVKNQLNFWDLLLDTRVKMQNMLNTVNQYPQHDRFEEIREKCGKDENTVNENQSLLEKAINQLAELQQRLVMSDSEMSSLVKELGIIGNEENNNNGSSGGEKKEKKRKRSDDEDEDEDEEEEDEDEDDEEIYSDTDEEMRANEAKKAKKSKQVANFSFTPLKPDDLESYLSKFNHEYLKYRNGTIQKWYDKTRLTTGKSFSALEKPILQQIEQILMDKERIIKRTQLKRTMLNIVGKEEEEKKQGEEEDDKTSLLRDRHLKDYDAEIFDDQDFYNQLVRELIDRRAANVADPIELARKSIEMNRLRAKTSKKKVDTKASKGRKIRYNVHKPLVNFMAPIYRAKMSDETRNELFKSLFGNHVIVSTSKSNGYSSSDIDFSSIFKGFN